MASVGDIIWAKLRGYPWWPAEIVKNERLPKALKSSENDLVPVYFFGSRDYALISREHIRKFDSEHWKLFRNKSSAPKFKSALAEARKKAKESISISPKTSDKLDTSVKKRGRPRKLKLIESREKLQKLLYSKDAKCTNEIVGVLTRINNANDLDRDECDSSKIGNLLKKVFCSDDYKLWHNNIEILKLVQRIAIKIINSK